MKSETKIAYGRRWDYLQEAKPKKTRSEIWGVVLIWVLVFLFIFGFLFGPAIFNAVIFPAMGI